MKKIGIVLVLATSLTAHAFPQSITVQVDPATLGWSSTTNLQQTTSDTYELVNTNSSNGVMWGNSPANGITPINSTINIYSSTVINGTTASTVFDADPAIHYALGVTNDSTTTAQTYTFIFSMPLTLALTAGTQVMVTSSVSGSVASGSDTPQSVSIGLGANPYIQQSYFGVPTTQSNGSTTGMDAGVDLLNATTTPSTPLVFAPNQSTAFGDNSSITATLPSVTLTANLTTISVVTSFTLSPDSSASFSGKFVVTTVANATPEPSTEALLVAGLGMLLLIVKRCRCAR